MKHLALGPVTVCCRLQRRWSSGRHRTQDNEDGQKISCQTRSTRCFKAGPRKEKPLSTEHDQNENLQTNLRNPRLSIRRAEQQNGRKHCKFKMVRVGRLELPHLAAPEPKSGASTNSATPASALSFSKATNRMREENAPLNQENAS